MAITPLYTPYATQIEYARMSTAVYEPWRSESGHPVTTGSWAEYSPTTILPLEDPDIGFAAKVFEKHIVNAQGQPETHYVVSYRGTDDFGHMTGSGLYYCIMKPLDPPGQIGFLRGAGFQMPEHAAEAGGIAAEAGG